MEIRKSDKATSELLDGYVSERSELAVKIQSLHIFFSLLVPDMTHEEKQLLDEAMVLCYQEKGIIHDNQSLFDPTKPGVIEKCQSWEIYTKSFFERKSVSGLPIS